MSSRQQVPDVSNHVWRIRQNIVHMNKNPLRYRTPPISYLLRLFDRSAWAEMHAEEITRPLGLLRRSRSFKVTKFGTNRKLVCDVLLVINSNLPPILHRFRDIEFERSKIGIFGYISFV